MFVGLGENSCRNCFRHGVTLSVNFHAPQVAETKTPYLMDAVGEALFYDEMVTHIGLADRQPMPVTYQAGAGNLCYRSLGELDHAYRKT